MSDTLSLKLLKVDNWGIFFLQRLQESFAKSNFCDLTLKFSGEAKLKVHRLVLNTCTEYFLGLEKQGNHEPNCLQLPNDLHPDVVLPIINFMYTGRLEFKEELQTQLYTTAKEMKMTILTRLLDAQTVPVPPVAKPQNKRVPPPLTYNLQGRKVIPKMIDPDLPETLPGRKLPIWKRRSAPPTLPPVNEAVHTEEFECNSREDPPRPTRFEWPEEEEGEELGFSGAFDSISYDSKPLQRPKEPSGTQQPCTSTPVPANSPLKPTVSFEELRKTVIHKRPANQPLAEAPGAKKGKVVDIQEVKEYLQEQELRKNLVDTEEEGGTEDDDFDDSVPVADLDDEEEEEKESSSAEESMTVTENVSHVEVVEPILSPSYQSESGSSMMEISPAHPQKSILKSRVSRELPDAPSKRVRFTLEAESQEGKENTTEETVMKQEHKEVSKVLPQTECSLSCSPTNPNNLSNHAKIISEVLKKYPHLVKDNKNIKLKIMQRGGHAKPAVAPVEGDSGKVVRSKVSYVVVKSNDATKGKVVLKRGAMSEPLSEFVNPEGQKPPSGAENTTGPWLCHSCGTNEEPINFETYYSYRKHLQDVHMEKIDARICEHCGHKASKRNLLLYHLYTRHNVPPPRNCQFPKCDQCDYVALSESLLIKHRNNHSNSRDFVCKVCNASFKSNGALQGHMQANLHGDPTKKKYECPYCRKPFVRNINLKAHIRSSHKEIARQLDGEEEILPDGKKKKTRPRILDSGSTVLHIQGSGSTSEEGAHAEHTVLVLQSGEKVIATSGMLQAPTLVPSSEAEALSNVASGIAASLGLNDAMTDVTENGNQSHRQENAGNSCSAFVIHDVSHSVHEYILPDIISGDLEVAQSYTKHLAELENYGGEEATTCALDSNTGHLTAVSTANGTTLVDIGKQIPVLLADPSAQLHGNELTGQRLTLVKDGVAIGVLVSQPSDTIGSNVISRADGEVSSGLAVDMNVSLPKLDKEMPTSEGAFPTEQAATYDGMPPILVREVPLDATAPSGTSTVVLVTLPPSSETGMPVALREADFEEAVKCFVLAQDGTGITTAPQITLMNAVPQEEAPREIPEKSMCSTGKIGRIGILKKKAPDPSRVMRSAPTTVPMVTGAFSPNRSSIVPHHQHIGILLPVDSVQKATGILPQQNQTSHINVVLSSDGSGGEITLVQADSDPAPPQAELVHPSDMTDKPGDHTDDSAKAPEIVPLTPVPSEGLQVIREAAPLGDKPLGPSMIISGVAVNDTQKDNNSGGGGSMALGLSSSGGGSSIADPPITNTNVQLPCPSNISAKPLEEKMLSQKILVPVEMAGHSEANSKLVILSENIVMQGVTSKTDSSLSNTSKFLEEGSSEMPDTLRQCVNSIMPIDEELSSSTPTDGTITSAEGAVGEGGNIHVFTAMQEKGYAELGTITASNLIVTTGNLTSQQPPASLRAQNVATVDANMVSESGVALSAVTGPGEIHGECPLVKDPKITVSEKDSVTVGIPSKAFTVVTGAASATHLPRDESQQGMALILPSCRNIPVEKCEEPESVINVAPKKQEIASVAVSEGDSSKPMSYGNSDKVT